MAWNYRRLAVVTALGFTLMSPGVAHAQSSQHADSDIGVTAVRSHLSNWSEAETTHVVLLGNGTETELVRLARNLERLHFLLTTLVGRSDAPDDLASARARKCLPRTIRAPPYGKALQCRCRLQRRARPHWPPRGRRSSKRTRPTRMPLDLCWRIMRALQAWASSRPSARSTAFRRQWNRCLARPRPGSTLQRHSRTAGSRAWHDRSSCQRPGAPMTVRNGRRREPCKFHRHKAGSRPHLLIARCLPARDSVSLIRAPVLGPLATHGRSQSRRHRLYVIHIHKS